MGNKIRTVAMSALLSGLLTLTGCVSIEADLTVRPDGKVDGSVIMAVSDELYDMGAGASLKETITEDPIEGSEIEPYAADGYKGYRVTFEGQEWASATGSTGSESRLTRKGDRFILDGVIDEATWSESSADAEPEFAEFIKFKMQVRFPGKILEHASGKLVDERTIAWSFKGNESNDFHVVALDHGSLFDSRLGRMLAAGGGVLGLAILVTVAAMIRIRRQRRYHATVATAGASHSYLAAYSAGPEGWAGPPTDQTASEQPAGPAWRE